MKNIALYTTIYPAMQPFLSAWKQSILCQTDLHFDLWVGVDEFSCDEATQLLKGLNIKKMVFGQSALFKAMLRQKALNEIVDQYDHIVLVDSDDVLMPSRVVSAYEQLHRYDVIGCAMQLVDEKGRDLNIRFGRQTPDSLESDFLFANQFGLSNTAYRSSVLKKCLASVPAQCVLFDWYLILNAWCSGAHISFDPVVRMQYRQHGHNVMKLLPPLSIEEIKSVSYHVLEHFDSFLKHSSMPSQRQKTLIHSRRKEVRSFVHILLRDPIRSKQYIDAFYRLSQDCLWGACVAHPMLRAWWEEPNLDDSKL